MTSVEVCVVTYENARTLPRLLSSIIQEIGYCNVAIHDNGPDGRDAALGARVGQDLGLSVRAEICPMNCGFAAGCNALSATSTADWVLFINPDAWVLSWDKAILAEASGIVGARIVDREGRLIQSWGAYRSMTDEVRRKWLRHLSPQPKVVGYVSGAAMACRREDFEALGGFDPGFFMYYEDIDLCHRALELGMTVTRNDKWAVAHAGGVSAKKAGVQALLWSYESGTYYHRKFGHSTRAFHWITLIDAYAHALYYMLANVRGAECKKWWRFASTLRHRTPAP